MVSPLEIVIFMRHSRIAAILLSLLLGKSWGFFAFANPVVSQNSAFCRQEEFQQSFTRWSQWGEWLGMIGENKKMLPLTVLTEIERELDGATENPKLIQLAIDRLTTNNSTLDEFTPQPLMNLLARLPETDRLKIVPMLEKMVLLSQSLGKGYNLAQTRSQIAAAQAYHKLGQRDRIFSLLTQASQSLTGIQSEQLQAEMALRLAESWFAVGESERGIAALDRTKNQIVALYKIQFNNDLFISKKLINFYLEKQQLEKAQKLAQELFAAGSDGSQLLRVAIAFYPKQPQVAQQLYNQAIQRLIGTGKSNPAVDIEITMAGIELAQIGEFNTAAKTAEIIPENQPHLRARIWLAIAGEARQNQQSEIATQAMDNMIMAGKIGEKQGFGMGFGDQRDYDWSVELYTLSSQNGYEPEMVEFIKRMNLQVNGAEFLIAEAIKAKRFDEAKNLIPIPMWRSIDAGVFEVQDWWLARVAIAAAKSGEFTQALEMAQAQSKNIPLLVELSQVLTAGGDKVNGEKLMALALAEASKLDDNPNRIEQLGIILSRFQEEGKTEEVQKILSILEKRLETIANLQERREKLLQVYQRIGQVNLDIYIKLAENLELIEEPNVAILITEASFNMERFDLTEKFITRISNPLFQVEWLVKLGEAYLSREDLVKAIAIFDRALAIAPTVTTDSGLLPNWWNTLPHAYLKLNRRDRAWEAAQAIDNQEQREYQLRRLAC
ncbi:MAG TPA: hypothetical protein DEG17_11070 [Cyanobacteria bacterium UBA11149]|nr:hypothetical protein [Cyanobacteria bacterium UBA11367]HBE57592.1 hypothetical protein [Cyanobacteria bacterium UBA11366]HBK62540.1 hypothetical protein [Cyanobacteria bacterium UBA11166]HBR77056.1 hypothetical protein [Cyanobacteria bacterium UBA11159]HBS71999.1 hypothetical protein [Cyanobacteria bacterium UBA11153]HBW89390.1 hypothetical protein [Cyanobacteria bacterium UBA11149]HCA97339.1 hypothetical protein [Cyanobacteria bacterium UBA9226]